MPNKKISYKSKKTLNKKTKPSAIKSTKKSTKLKPVIVRQSILYVFAGTLYLFLFVNIIPAVVASVQGFNVNTNSQVLGDDDKMEEEEEEKEEDESEDKNEDEKSEENDEQKNQEELAKKIREQQKEQLKKQEELRKKSKSVTVTISPEGYKTVTETEIEGDKVKTESKTYDAFGKKIGESKLEEQENETEIKAKTMGETGVESKYEFKDKNGSVVMLKIREGDNSWSKLMYNEKNGLLLVKQKSDIIATPSEEGEQSPNLNEDGTLAIKINEGGSFDLVSSGISASTDLPVEVDGEEGKVYVANTELTVNPDQVADEAITNAGVETVESVSITKENGVTVYKVVGLDNQKFLGLFDVTLPKTLYYSVDTNTLISESKSAIQNLIDAFSF